jgi:hypothetical protein
VSDIIKAGGVPGYNQRDFAEAVSGYLAETVAARLIMRDEEGDGNIVRRFADAYGYKEAPADVGRDDFNRSILGHGTSRSMSLMSTRGGAFAMTRKVPSPSRMLDFLISYPEKRLFQDVIARLDAYCESLHAQAYGQMNFTIERD